MNRAIQCSCIPQDIGGLQLNRAPAGGGRNPARFARRIAELGYRRVDLQTRLRAEHQSGGFLRLVKISRGHRQRREHLDVFVGELLPGNSLRGYSQPRSRIIKTQDPAIGVSFLSHDLCADLAEPNPVTKSAAMERNLITAVADVVQIALQPLPSDMTSDRRTKSQPGYCHIAPCHHAKELDPSARSAVQDRNR